MMSYYTVLIALCWLSLSVLCILVHETSWISRPDKRLFYMTYGIIALSALAEWAGLQVSGSSLPGWILAVVKCADYILTPMAGGAITAQMKLRSRLSRALMVLLAANAVFQVVAAFTGWMIIIDAQNHYTHGPLYGIYIAVYMLVILLTGAEFQAYGSAYRKQNKASLYSVLLLVVIGIALQEILGGEYRTAYIALTMGVALMFIHYSEFYQMTAQEYIQTQHMQLMKDAMSGVYSRYAYIKDLEHYTAAGIPDLFTAFTIDINGLKETNDSIGHDAGDELISGAARCIEKVVKNAGRCYRTGGDEFVVLAQMPKEQAEAVLADLAREAALWKGEKADRLSFSAGFAAASDYPGLTAEALIKKADQAMYAEKAEYYLHSGDRRRSPR